MPPTPVVRPAVLSDLDSLCTIEQTCFTSDILSRRSLRAMIAHPRHLLWVAVMDKNLVGYILVFNVPHHKKARIYSLAVLPQCRGHGIGRLLMHAIEPLLHTKQAIRLEVREDNHGAQKLYCSLGYITTKHKAGYYEDGQNAIEMEKTLP